MRLRLPFLLATLSLVFLFSSKVQAGGREQDDVGSGVKNHFAEAADIIARLPTASKIEDYRQQARSSVDLRGKNEALSHLKRAIEDYRSLRHLLKIKDSVFDYDGLLALAPTTYDRTTKTYRMRLGLYSLIPEGADQEIFNVNFDNNGKIVSIKYILLAK
jgi:hypothetical protein